MRRLYLAWAAIPVGLAGLLVWHSTREDSYVSDGSSYWETHSEGHAWVVAAVVIDLCAAALLVAVRGHRLLPVIGGALAFVALFATLAAGLAISAN